MTMLARLRRDPAALAALAILGALVALAIFGPLVLPYSYDQVNKAHMWAPPLTRGHLLGADWLGRDLAARLLAGLRISLIVGIVATVVALAIGIIWGVIAGYVGGALDEAMMRGVDVLYALPFIIFVVLLTVRFGNGLAVILVAIASVEWLTMARVVRGQTLSLKEREFVAAARAFGASDPAVMTRHVAPNLITPATAYLTLTVPSVIIAESFLSFLGLGVQEPLASLGTLMAEGANQMELAPWLLIAPAATMIALLASFNQLGEALRRAAEAADPQ